MKKIPFGFTIKATISQYKAKWHAGSHTGTIWIYYGGGKKKTITLTDPSEFSAMIDLLRNEKPMYTSIVGETKDIITAKEDPGEEET